MIGRRHQGQRALGCPIISGHCSPAAAVWRGQWTPDAQTHLFTINIPLEWTFIVQTFPWGNIHRPQLFVRRFLISRWTRPSYYWCVHHFHRIPWTTHFYLPLFTFPRSYITQVPLTKALYIPKAPFFLHFLPFWSVQNRLHITKCFSIPAGTVNFSLLKAFVHRNTLI